MAGRPKRRAMIEELERLTRDYFDVETADNPHSHLDYVVAMNESGKPLSELARNISNELAFQVQRQVLSKYIYDTFPDAAERLSRARPIMGHALVEEALAIVDAPMYEKVDVARAALRARTREGVAKMLNPEFQQQKAGLTLNVGSLHLAALAPGLAAHTRVSLEPAMVAEGALVAPLTTAISASDNSPQPL